MLSKDVTSADKPKGPELFENDAALKPDPEALGEKVPWSMGGLMFFNLNLCFP